ncbi:5'-methylthioadenosine/S-adenosylhomocysteine nucleosidase [Wukongibacter sp. M2B1]|uniref:5'-methylthioadenosine/S-adenosylhomocysteine nucleosidase n=1 Tax=Wukongibacter sp. M2B1 TaxID=3088895 RepID=UPI003D7B3E94
MKKIGIVCALADEAKNIIESISLRKEIKYLFANFTQGVINGKDVVVSCCGIGGASAEIATRILINKFEIDHMIILGTAGGISPRVKVGDAVILEDIILYNHENDDINGCSLNPYVFDCDDMLREKAKKACLSVMGTDRVVMGRIATVDTFVDSSDFKEDIYMKCNADCVEMESGYIAKVCNDYNVPFVVVRVISDQSDRFATDCFKANIDNISSKLKEIVIKIL